MHTINSMSELLPNQNPEIINGTFYVTGLEHEALKHVLETVRLLGGTMVQANLSAPRKERQEGEIEPERASWEDLTSFLKEREFMINSSALDCNDTLFPEGKDGGLDLAALPSFMRKAVARSARESGYTRGTLSALAIIEHAFCSPDLTLPVIPPLPNDALKSGRSFFDENHFNDFVKRAKLPLRNPIIRTEKILDHCLGTDYSQKYTRIALYEDPTASLEPGVYTANGIEFTVTAGESKIEERISLDTLVELASDLSVNKDYEPLLPLKGQYALLKYASALAQQYNFDFQPVIKRREKWSIDETFTRVG